MMNDDDDDDLSVCREDLAELKKGEETKSKDYEALCIKLDHSEFDEVGMCLPHELRARRPAAAMMYEISLRYTFSAEIQPSILWRRWRDAADIARINAFRNTPADDPRRPAVRLVQRTPIRVLHRRPLLARDKHILSMRAEPVQVTRHSRTWRCWCCGCARAPRAYVKEFVHGSWAHAARAGRRPRSPADLLALDVTRVALPCRPRPASGARPAGAHAGPRLGAASEQGRPAALDVTRVALPCRPRPLVWRPARWGARARAGAPSEPGPTCWR
ncbi:hypothetical protein MSG28_006453 [Choristoneura fumiferana]|uniref:Uncharacterized protein n=1 Tax=Choristoneura fumiferana TaxID=7141 RepID=A0ACC0JEZ2_CHOFU|nr:hypothetical protein MSG28_006453 [Choristoneura fumiferana]